MAGPRSITGTKAPFKSPLSINGAFPSEKGSHSSIFLLIAGTIDSRAHFRHLSAHWLHNEDGWRLSWTGRRRTMNYFVSYHCLASHEIMWKWLRACVRTSVLYRAGRGSSASHYTKYSAENGDLQSSENKITLMNYLAVDVTSKWDQSVCSSVSAGRLIPGRAEWGHGSSYTHLDHVHLLFHS